MLLGQGALIAQNWLEVERLIPGADAFRYIYLAARG
jgi:hypothetical protein